MNKEWKLGSNKCVYRTILGLYSNSYSQPNTAPNPAHLSFATTILCLDQ